MLICPWAVELQEQHPFLVLVELRRGSGAVCVGWEQLEENGPRIAVLRHLHHRPEQRQVRDWPEAGASQKPEKRHQKRKGHQKMERAPEKGIVKMRGKWKRNSGGKRKRRVDKETDKGICACYLTSSSTRLNLRVWLVQCDRGHGRSRSTSHRRMGNLKETIFIFLPSVLEKRQQNMIFY